MLFGSQHICVNSAVASRLESLLATDCGSGPLSSGPHASSLNTDTGVARSRLLQWFRGGVRLALDSPAQRAGRGVDVGGTDSTSPSTVARAHGRVLRIGHLRGLASILAGSVYSPDIPVVRWLFNPEDEQAGLAAVGANSSGLLFILCRIYKLLLVVIN